MPYVGELSIQQRRLGSSLVLDSDIVSDLRFYLGKGIYKLNALWIDVKTDKRGLEECFRRGRRRKSKKICVQWGSLNDSCFVMVLSSFVMVSKERWMIYSIHTTELCAEIIYVAFFANEFGFLSKEIVHQHLIAWNQMCKQQQKKQLLGKWTGSRCSLFISMQSSVVGFISLFNQGQRCYQRTHFKRT